MSAQKKLNWYDLFLCAAVLLKVDIFRNVWRDSFHIW